MSKKINFKRKPGTINIEYDVVETQVGSSIDLLSNIQRLENQIAILQANLVEAQAAYDAAVLVEPQFLVELKFTINLIDNSETVPTKTEVRDILTADPFNMNVADANSTYDQAITIIGERV
jgi:hypothetical protein